MIKHEDAKGEESALDSTINTSKGATSLNNGYIEAENSKSVQDNEESKAEHVIKEKEGRAVCKLDIVLENDYIFETLLSFFTFEEIYRIIVPLSKIYRNHVEDANYLLLTKLADKLNITSSFMTSDLPAHWSVVDIYKDAMRAVETGDMINLKPNAFFTDSGLVGTNMWYSFHNIFETNTTMYYGYVFSSSKGSNNHVQCYLCVPGNYDNTFNQKLKTEFEKSPASKEICVPYDKYPSDGTAPTFKIPKIFEINCKNQGYSYYTDNLALFFSDTEVDNSKFNKSTKLFETFKSVSEVKNNSKLPIHSVYDAEKGLTVIEFDLSKKNEIMKAMGINKFVSIPLVYINIDKNLAYGKTLKYEFKQNVAAKYMSMKLICWSTYQTSSQLDMFPCALKGISLNF